MNEKDEEEGSTAPEEGEAEEDTPDDDTFRTDPYSVLMDNPDDEAPVTVQDHLTQGEERLKSGQINEALDSYREAVRTARSKGEDDTDYRVQLGDAYAYSGQGLNAFRQYRRAIKNSPRKAEPHFAMGELYQKYGRLQSAIAEFQKAIAFAPQNAYYHYKLGDALALADDLESAIAALEESVHLKPQDGFYHFWLGDLYARAHRDDEAVREMQQATLFSPYDAYYNVRLAALYRKIEALPDAIEAMKMALKICPENAAYHCLLADFYSDLNEDNLSIYHYQTAGPLDDYDQDILNRLRRFAGTDQDLDLLALEDFDA